MSDQAEPPAVNLEQQLRDMILGNVRISEDKSKQPHQSNPRSPQQPRPQTHGYQGNRHRNANAAARQANSQLPAVQRPQVQNGANQSRAFSSPRKGNNQLQGSGAIEVKKANQSAAQSALPNPRILQRPQQPKPTGHGLNFAPQPINPVNAQSGSIPRPQVHAIPFHVMFAKQADFCEHLAAEVVPSVEMTQEEFAHKEAFRITLQGVAQKAITESPFRNIPHIALQAYGSFMSGFATQGSDMDLSLVLGNSTEAPVPLDREIPRLLEKAYLEMGYGARLLTRTRVPIIKICEKPTPDLLKALNEERDKWDALPEEEKWPSHIDLTGPAVDGAEPTTPVVETHDEKTEPAKVTSAENAAESVDSSARDNASKSSTDADQPAGSKPSKDKASKKPDGQQHTNKTQERAWTREKKLGPLDFPKVGLGIQCDINFSNLLAMHNTTLLRCYARCDHRVRPMVLFIKIWAKKRKINHPYSGTLSSYGYVLMVLHFLMNVCQPPVVPNLQHMADPYNPKLQPRIINGYNVDFFDNEASLQQSADTGHGSRNRESLGALLRNFFFYYGSSHQRVNGMNFHWMQEVIAIRMVGGILTKEMKGWTAAKSTNVENREVRHRYLFAIEDPFELDHNVARTVTHNGIVAIRDEFRRAVRILNAIGNDREHTEGGLMDPIIEPEPKEEEPKNENGKGEAVAGKVDADASSSTSTEPKPTHSTRATNNLTTAAAEHPPANAATGKGQNRRRRTRNDDQQPTISLGTIQVKHD